MAKGKNYLPALKYDWLTRVYDPVLQLTMSEKRFKRALISQLSIQPGDRVFDFGCGSLTLSLMAAKAHPMTEFHGVDIDDRILAIAKQKVAQCLNGFEATRDNVENVLPKALSQSGFLWWRKWIISRRW